MDKVEEAINKHQLEDEKYNMYANTSQAISFLTDEGMNIEVVLKKYLNRAVSRSQNVINLSEIIENLDIAFLIEAGIYEYSLIYCIANNYSPSLMSAIYDDRYTNIVYELKNKDINGTLLTKLKSKEIDPQELAFMDPHDINPENWDELIRKRKLIEYKKNNIAATDLYKCYQCGERKCQVRQVQTRGADEPMTLFITCLVCHNEFRK